eukprot:8435880-Lingulodinium_polyedra.AAC.1
MRLLREVHRVQVAHGHRIQGRVHQGLRPKLWPELAERGLGRCAIEVAQRQGAGEAVCPRPVPRGVEGVEHLAEVHEEEAQLFVWLEDQ